MLATLSMLAEGIFVFPWYSWAGLGLIVVILIGYKLFKDKTMT